MSKKPKFTPGPWELDDSSIVMAGDGSVICSVNTLDDFPCIAEDNSEHQLTLLESELEANARLIATAPEMYDFIATLENDDGKIPDWLWQKRRELLKKADGEA